MDKGKPFRKPDFRTGGMQVKICGRPLRTGHNLICTLPYRHSPPHVHGTLATSDNGGDIIAILDNTHEEEVDMWLLVEGPHD